MLAEPPLSRPSSNVSEWHGTTTIGTWSPQRPHLQLIELRRTPYPLHVPPIASAMLFEHHLLPPSLVKNRGIPPPPKASSPVGESSPCGLLLDLCQKSPNQSLPCRETFMESIELTSSEWVLSTGPTCSLAYGQAFGIDNLIQF